MVVSPDIFGTQSGITAIDKICGKSYASVTGNKRIGEKDIHHGRKSVYHNPVVYRHEK